MSFCSRGDKVTVRGFENGDVKSDQGVVAIDAVLLLGPTGAGKTPLGQILEQKGLEGTPCHHFDFGEQLRKIAHREMEVPRLSAQDIEIISESLKTGKLLEKKNFHIIGTLLQAFIRQRCITKGQWLVLNGVPRHLDQALDMHGIVDISLIICLACSEQAIKNRIQWNTGGDRTQRTDDSQEQIKKKLNLYLQRTLPLLYHYRARHVQTVQIDVLDDMKPMDMLDCLLSELSLMNRDEK